MNNYKCSLFDVVVILLSSNRTVCNRFIPSSPLMYLQVCVYVLVIGKSG